MFACFVFLLESSSQSKVDEWDQHCGIACKATICDANSPYEHWSSLPHFWLSSLVLACKSNRRWPKSLGPCYQHWRPKWCLIKKRNSLATSGHHSMSHKMHSKGCGFSSDFREPLFMMMREHERRSRRTMTHASSLPQGLKDMDQDAVSLFFSTCLAYPSPSDWCYLWVSLWGQWLRDITPMLSSSEFCISLLSSLTLTGRIKEVSGDGDWKMWWNQTSGKELELKQRVANQKTMVLQWLYQQATFLILVVTYLIFHIEDNAQDPGSAERKSVSPAPGVLLDSSTIFWALSLSVCSRAIHSAWQWEELCR